jgi:hypothetical protein
MKFRAGLIAATVLMASTNCALAAQPKAGTLCKKAGMVKVVSGITYKCIKKGSKNLWKESAKAKSESMAPTAAPTHTASRDGFKVYSVKMARAHLPQAPTNGSDDYRCFLLDPMVTEDSIIRSIEFVPQKKEYVHHAIIFRVSASDLPEAIALDKSGIGWPCFGGSGLGGMFSTFVTSPWISAWAPGRGKDLAPSGYGIPFKKGERFVLQVHYNLLAANGGKIETDQSSIIMEAEPASESNVMPLVIELFPAPVELACPPGVTGPLCDRRQSLMDLASRTNNASMIEVFGIATICGQNAISPKPSLVSTCDQTIQSDYRIVTAAPHMHLLGRKLKMTLNPGKSNEQVMIDVQNYDFDDQSPIELVRPIKVSKGDVVRIECTFDPGLRQVLPALKNLPPRYITWGEGSSDEMCLGVLSVAKT